MSALFPIEIALLQGYVSSHGPVVSVVYYGNGRRLVYLFLGLMGRVGYR